MNIHFLENKNDRSLTARITGDCDLYNAQHLFHDITEKMNEAYQAVCVDLSGVPYLDSSGIWAVIRIIQHAKTNSIALTFRGITGAVRKVMRLSNILSIIREEA
ncbi:MAG: STAS domain-containing protein [Treponema sp.]|jgi:anti-anti-sigma factor|nr:STAS domain-containing protein [Treponema sp.]